MLPNSLLTFSTMTSVHVVLTGKVEDDQGKEFNSAWETKLKKRMALFYCLTFHKTTFNILEDSKYISDFRLLVIQQTLSIVLGLRIYSGNQAGHQELRGSRNTCMEAGHGRECTAAEIVCPWEMHPPLSRRILEIPPRQVTSSEHVAFSQVFTYVVSWSSDHALN